MDRLIFIPGNQNHSTQTFPLADSGVQNPTVFVVMTVHNRNKITDQCLRNLYDQSYKSIQIVVVDDGSTDGTSEMIKTKYPAVHLLNGDGNYWWSKCMNLGLKAVLKSANKNDIVLTLNDDTIFSNNYIEKMVSDIGTKVKTIMGSLILIGNQNDRVFFAGARFDPWFSRDVPNYPMGATFHDFNQHFIETDYIPGRGAAFPVSVFNDIGFYDEEHLPHYWSDYDFTLRAKKSGYKLLINTKAVVKTNLDRVSREKYFTGIKPMFVSFFDIKSSTRLVDRYHFSRKHGRLPLLHFFVNVVKIFIRSMMKAGRLI